ncbi:MAG: hypothetical protein U9O56_08975, partial [Campylobacterota bacterium]|nr:hypothetical protein [Campylobacterota bacterium]
LALFRSYGIALYISTLLFCANNTAFCQLFVCMASNFKFDFLEIRCRISAIIPLCLFTSFFHSKGAQSISYT